MPGTINFFLSHPSVYLNVFILFSLVVLYNVSDADGIRKQTVYAPRGLGQGALALVCLSAGHKTSAFSSHSSANFHLILDCFLPKFKVKYEDSENSKAGSINSYFQLTSNQISGILGVSSANVEVDRYRIKIRIDKNVNLLKIFNLLVITINLSSNLEILDSFLDIHFLGLEKGCSILPPVVQKNPLTLQYFKQVTNYFKELGSYTQAHDWK